MTSKLWNDKHGENDVIPSCEKTLADLQLDYLDLYLMHWPFPNFHPPGCEVKSRSPGATPYIHENYMRTWRAAGEAGGHGAGQHTGTSNMTIPKLELAATRRRDPAGREPNGAAPAFSAAGAVPTSSEHGIVPVGYSPLGSPGRPERDRTSEDTVDIEDPVILDIAGRLGVHPAVVCLKWARAARPGRRSRSQ